jgi:ATP phosphoribosyltransferase regulatory subunit
VEWFGAENAPAADAEVLSLAVRAARAAGVRAVSITLGDVGLIRALLADIDMPPRWRARLLRRLRRPRAFRATLAEMTGENGPRARTSISPLIDELAAEPTMERALALAEAELARRGLELVGGRTLEEIAARLLEKAENRAAAPLPREKAALIERLLAVSGPLKPVLVQLGRLTEEAGPALRAAWEAYAARVEHIARLLPEEVTGMTFDAGFGRTFDYYTGFVFQLEAAIGERRLPVGGGGRYDDMLESLGGPAVPALGMALHLPRLSAAAREEGAAA